MAPKVQELPKHAEKVNGANTKGLSDPPSAVVLKSVTPERLEQQDLAPQEPLAPPTQHEMVLTKPHAMLLSMSLQEYNTSLERAQNQILAAQEKHRYTVEAVMQQQNSKIQQIPLGRITSVIRDGVMVLVWED